ncbi:hypothetical protein C7476_11454 [Phyllobacterium bourgognense]|uniref:Uncharacterized protein n=1 Tax=Phyllobacterium bourgognense TaxID=314236 RepID=A0A368YJD1_9HYPH|nr:hypothetical protein C7476_11454 [Phyllobacterium bourgognense]
MRVLRSAPPLTSATMISTASSARGCSAVPCMKSSQKKLATQVRRPVSLLPLSFARLRTKALFYGWKKILQRKKMASHMLPACKISGLIRNVLSSCDAPHRRMF